MVDISNVSNTVNVKPAPAPEPKTEDTEESGAKLAAPPATTEKAAQEDAPPSPPETDSGTQVDVSA